MEGRSHKRLKNKAESKKLRWPNGLKGRILFWPFKNKGQRCLSGTQIAQL